MFRDFSRKALGGLMIALVPLIAWAQLSTTGVGVGFFGGGNSYVGSGVRFDASLTHMETQSPLTSAGTAVPGGDTGATRDTCKFLISFNIQGLPWTANTAILPLTSAGADLFANIELVSTEGNPGEGFAFDNAAPFPPASMRTATGDAYADHSGATQAGHTLIQTLNGAQSADWQNVVAAMNACNVGSTSKLITTYINRVKQGSGGAVASLVPGFTATASASATTLTVTSASPSISIGALLTGSGVTPGTIITAGTDGGGAGSYTISPSQTFASTSITGTYAAHVSSSRGWLIANLAQAVTGVATFNVSDVQVFYGVDGGINGSNDLPTATLNAFTDLTGRPVDPGPHCRTDFGQTAQLCFTGNKTAFATNKGTVTNTFVSAGLMDASCGPVRVAHTVCVVGGSGYSDQIVSGGTSATAHDIGVATLAGDVIFGWAGVKDGGSPINHNVQCPTGYTLVPNTRQASTANGVSSSAMCYHVVLTNGETTAMTWNWTTASSSPGHPGTWATWDLRGADTSNPIDASTANNNDTPANTTSWTFPAIQPVVTNAFLFNLASGWGSTSFTTIPTGENRFLTAGIAPPLAMHFETLTSAANVAAKALTQSGDNGPAVSVTIKPN